MGEEREENGTQVVAMKEVGEVVEAGGDKGREVLGLEMGEAGEDKEKEALDQ